MTAERTDRHDPRGSDDYLSIQHVERYRFACRHLAPGSRVLDVACGTAYGAEMLRDHGCEVVAGDLDPEELKEARRQVLQIDFVCLDVRNLPFADGSFDAVVSFETIEHVIEGGEFLNEMKRVLRPGGVFIGSTPNIAYTAHPWYHVKEYRPDEYFSLVLGVFGNIEEFGQYFSYRDRIRDLLVWRLAKLPDVIASVAKLALRSLRTLRTALKRPINSRQSTSTAAPAISEDRAGDCRVETPYAVVTLQERSLLRIMVSMSTKGFGKATKNAAM